MIRAILALLALLAGAPAYAAGTLPIALQQQLSFTGCSTAANVCGTPLASGLLYFYQVGTVATPQNSYQDTGLTILNPWPLTLDANGRVPPFYLADGSVHVRLTDSSGVVQFDYPSMLVIGPSGGGGGGGSVDPTTIASTGDIKFRATGETLSGWVKANGQTIGSATSGATGRANSDTQNLFVYLWTNCPDTHCPVLGGRGASGLADFNANKQLTLLDLRGRIPYGLDDMGNTASGRLLAQNITGAGDTPTTPNGVAGETNHTISQAQIPNYALSLSTNVTDTRVWQGNGGGSVGAGNNTATSTVTGIPTVISVVSGSITASTTGNSGGSGSSMNVVNNSLLGTWFIRL